MGATQKPRFLQGYLNFRNMNAIMGQPRFRSTIMGLTIFLGIPVAGVCWFSDNEEFYSENRELYAKKRINFTANNNPNPVYKAEGVRVGDIAKYTAGIFVPQDLVFGRDTPLNTHKALNRLSAVQVDAQAKGDGLAFFGHGYVNAKYIPVEQAEYNEIALQGRKNLKAVYDEHKSAIKA